MKKNTFLNNLQNEIISIFGITKDDIASICGVSEINVRNWSRKESIDCSNRGMNRLFKLSRAAKSWRNAGYPPVPKKSLHDPVIKDESLYDALTNSNIDVDRIVLIGARLALVHLNH